MIQTINIPWQAWYGDEMFDLGFSKNWDVQVCGMSDADEIGQQGIREAFANPIHTSTIAEMALGKKTVAIAVEDITRPSLLNEILNEIARQLQGAGIRDEQVKIVISTGGHRPLLRDDLIKKLGRDIVERFDIYNHNPFENLVDTGIILGKVPVRINRFFIEAEFKIVVGTIVPHAFAGFSGGGKIVLPGLAGIEILERSHKFVMMGLRGGIGEVDGNRFREEVEGVAKKIGVDLGVNLVVNSKRGLAGVFVGDVVDAHRAGVRLAREVYATNTPEGIDVAILNAYPKDMEMFQIDNAFGMYRSAGEGLVKDDGVVILTSACSLGRGYHALFEPGMRLHKPPAKRKFLGNRELWVYSPNINKADFATLFWDGYSLFNRWDDVIERLEGMYNKNCHLAIFPYSSLQIAKNRG
ncbi:MAG: lactate racemase domain-containing protein [bacterium]|nr:lactate racemase domain-containing protein [bacterium]